MAKFLPAFLSNVVALQPSLVESQKALDRNNAVQVLTNRSPSNPLNKLDDDMKHEILTHFAPANVPNYFVHPFFLQYRQKRWLRNSGKLVGDLFHGPEFDWINRVDPSFKQHSLDFHPDNDLYILEYSGGFHPNLEIEIIHFDQWLQRPEVNLFLNDKYIKEDNWFYVIDPGQQNLRRLLHPDELTGRLRLDDLLMDPPDDRSLYFQARKPPHPQMQDRRYNMRYSYQRAALIMAFYHVWYDPTANFLKPRLTDLRERLADPTLDEKERDLCRRNIILLQRGLKQQEMYNGTFRY